MDEIDRDQNINEHFLQILISQARSRPANTPEQLFCLLCHAPIPEQRRILLPGVRLCVTCQARAERGC